MEHQFTLQGTWRGGLYGDGHVAVGNLDSAVSVPTALQGPGKGTNPEELLLGASAACYLITLGAILERRKLEPREVTLASEGYVSSDKGLKFTRIVHRPRIVLAEGASDEDRKTARDATDRAEKACLISNAVRGNVQVTVEPEIA